jgi:hypothetical protein
MPQRASVVDLGAGCLGHWPVGIQNREHVADAGLAVGSDRRHWASIMTRAYFRGCGGGESRHWVFFGLQRTGYCLSPTKRRRSAEREAQSQGMAARLGSSFGRKRKKPLLHATVMSEAINIGEPEFEGDSLSYFQSLVVIMPPARVPTPPPPARQAPPPTLWLPPAAIGPLPGRRRPFHSSGPAAGGDRGRARGDARGRDVCLGTALVHLRATLWATGLGY